MFGVDAAFFDIPFDCGGDSRSKAGPDSAKYSYPII